MTIQLYRFGPGEKVKTTDKAVLGGKGAGLAQMAAIGLPVPPGFTLPCDLSMAYLNANANDQETLMKAVMDMVLMEVEAMTKTLGYTPLFSVRSGARESMPGMMDTLLNVGMATGKLVEWADRIGNRAALDSYRRLIQMFGATALGVPHERFEHILAAKRKKAGAKTDADLDEVALAEVVDAYLTEVKNSTKMEFPQALATQLRVAIETVFKSWNTERAKIYRKDKGFPDDWGTAVNIQAMVFGNTGNDSGSGVLFTRNPATGAPGLYGEFLPNAQGEEIVAGTRTPLNVAEMEKMDAPWPAMLAKLGEIANTLEKHYGDMQDTEFTVQAGTLYMLQTRKGKRTAQAAFRVAADMLDEIGDAALALVTPDSYFDIQRPALDPSFKMDPHGQGLAAGPGLAQGKAVFSSADAMIEAANGPVIMITRDTNPDDIGGMIAAVGLLTSTGGVTSHAAVVARDYNKPGVVGCEELEVLKDSAKLGSLTILKGALVTIDGDTGRIWVNTQVPIIEAGTNPYVKTVLARLFEKYGLMWKGVEAAASSVYFQAAALAGEGAAIAKARVLDLVKDWEAGDLKTLVLDLTKPYDLFLKEDIEFLHAFGANAAKTWGDQELLAVVETLVENPMKGAKVVLPEGFHKGATKALKTAGYLVVREAETIADLLEGGACSVSASFIDTVFGNKDAYEVVSAALAKAGKPIELYSPAQAVTPEVAVSEFLGKATDDQV